MSVVNGGAAAPSLTREHVNIIHSAEGKRYKLNVRTPIGCLTLGKVKQCLAAASSCPIPLNDMVLHLNGVPLSTDDDLCASFGIGSGATLSVEARHRSDTCSNAGDGSEGAWQLHSLRSHVAKGTRSPADAAVTDGTSPPSLLSSFPMSDRRSLLELQTLQQQNERLQSDGVVKNEVLRHTLHYADAAMEHATRRRCQLERQRETADEALRCVKDKEAEVARERERLSILRAQEAARATKRTEQLAERREQLRAEQEATRAVAMLKLENEKKKALLAQQQTLLEAERERAQLEQECFEATTKARELELRAREIDIEHQRLARIREVRALDLDRRLAVQQRLRYYAQLGVEAPQALQREAAALLPTGRGEDHDGDSSYCLTVSQGHHRNATLSTMGPEGRTGKSVEKVGDTSNGGLVRSRRSPSPLQSHAKNGIAAVVPAPDSSFYDARDNADANLRRLGDDLGLCGTLHFDDTNTCIIGIDGEYTLLVTYDAATERLYLYSTLLASLPPIVQATVESRIKMYEFLLEASLLGREMCGGGVGASIRNDFVLMSASLYMPTSQPWSLCTLVPQFLHCLRHWRTKLAEFLETLEAQEGYAQSVSSSAVAPTPPEVSPETPQQHPHTSAPPSKLPLMARSAHHPGSPAIRVVGTHPQSSVTSPSPSQGSQSIAAAAAPLTSYAGSSNSNVMRATPVLGLEVTSTVLANGVPTHYNGGVLVVNTAGPSVLAGVQPNDFIEELNGVRIRNVSDFRRVIEEKLTPGMLVPVRINRDGLAMVVTVRVEAAWSP
ncbi:hypothetical protein JKF63_07263 [Porcisia hertigi]|uniref:PDZ domain-containing protein n=1 Tax=Porcisia hertigi TaxID=2761500 RepID=A0A837A9G7_9TRYP|nr:hypothetical protein JKF63_07263 [Porcisia hertigi]